MEAIPTKTDQDLMPGDLFRWRKELVRFSTSMYIFRRNSTQPSLTHETFCPRCRRSTAAPRGGCLVPSLPAAPWPQRAATGPQQCLVRLKKGQMCRRPFLVRASGSWGNPPAPLRGGLVLAGGGRAAPKMAAPCPRSRWLLGGGVVLLKSWRYLRFMA